MLVKAFMKEYLNGNYKVDKTATYFKLLSEIRDNIANIVGDNYIVKFSCGIGNRSDIPWICIFNKKVTSSAKKGIYIAILFKSDMSGLYLSLSQGMTYFKHMYGIAGLDYLDLLVLFFRNMCSNDFFDFNMLDLGVKSRSSRGYGYERANIISKYYIFDDCTQENIENDVLRLLSIYNFVCSSMGNLTYDDIVEKIVGNRFNYLTEEDIFDINLKKSVILESEFHSLNDLELIEISVPKGNLTGELAEIKKTSAKKIDYVTKTRKNVEIGIKGEILVIEYEKNKLISLGREDLASKVIWVSQFDDFLGYDILSYLVDENGKEKEIYIEVKTTELSRDSIFYVSANEYDTMKKFGSSYWIYRVCIVGDKNCFYKVNGIDFKKNFNVFPNKYVVELKN